MKIALLFLKATLKSISPIIQKLNIACGSFNFSTGKTGKGGEGGRQPAEKN